MAVRASAIFLVMVSAVLCTKCAMAANQYTVGGSQGWELNTDLSTWLSGKKFASGDALVFKYAATHSVLEVSKADYDSCQIANAIQTHTDGNTVVTLSSPGKRYFICGTPGHCSAGMKVEIDTLAAASAPAPRASPPASRTVPPVSAPSKVPVSSPSASTPSKVPVSSPSAFTPSPSKVPVSSPSASTPSPSSSVPASAPTTLTLETPSSSPTEAPASVPSTAAVVPKSSSSPAPSPPSESAANSLCGVKSLVVMTSAAAAAAVAMVML